MNDKQKRRLEVVSRIDDDIVERNTQKRVRLLQGNSRRKWIISITSMAAAIALIATTTVLLVTLLGKQVPIYTGMTVSNEMPTSAVTFSGAVTDYNAPGGVKGDQTGRGPIDQAKPFSNGKKPIGEAVKSSLAVSGSNVATYYAKAGEFVYITVHVDNPDSFEILSFTLNGRKYVNYEFEYGSDLENLILKVQIPEDAEGKTSYTIDAIKYVDGEKIKDVRMDGNRTVDIAVYIEEQPTATLSGEVLDFNSIAFNATVTDTKGLLGMSESKLLAVLYDGDSLVASKELTLGTDIAVRFEGLATNRLYQYAVVALYDALDGEGVTYHVLAKQAVFTKYVVLFDNVTPTPYTVSFSLLWEASIENKTLLTLALYKGESKLRDLAVTDTEVTGLEAGAEYRLVGTYQKGEGTEQIEVTFSTVSSTVTFNSNGKTTSQAMIEGAALPAATRQGFTFAGWFTAEGVQVTTVPTGSVTVFAKWAEDTPADAFSYTIAGGKATLTGLNRDCGQSLFVPAYVGGYPVTKLAWEAFKDCSALTTVVLPESVTEISGKAFLDCTALQAIVLPSSLKAIGTDAFDGCNSLSRVEYTGNFAGWLSVSFDASFNSNPVRISQALYIGGVDITEAPPAIPESITVLQNWALAGFNGLRSVSIPTSVEKMGIGVFSGCNAIESLTTPVLKVTFNLGIDGMEGYDGMQYLFISGKTADWWACSVPTILTTVHIVDITETPDYFGDNAPFKGFSALTTVTLPDGLQRIGMRTFRGCTLLTSINIPTSVTEIGGQAFLGCGITQISLPSGISEIEMYTFYGSALTEITIPASVRAIHASAFLSCTALQRVTFATGSELTTLCPNAFAGCTELVELSLPATATSLGRGIFGGCTKLQRVTLPIPGIACTECSYYNVTSFKQLFDSDEVSDTGTVPPSLTTVVINGGTAIPDLFFDLGVHGATITSITVGATVSSIGQNAFYSCTGLETVSFGNTAGWWVATSPTATSGDSVDVGTPSTNVTHLTSTYQNYYWKRS